MTYTEAEMMNRLAMSLDTCLDLVTSAAKDEKRKGAGKPLRPITWQQRAEHFPALVDDAREALSADGKRAYF